MWQKLIQIGTKVVWVIWWIANIYIRFLVGTCKWILMTYDSMDFWERVKEHRKWKPKVRKIHTHTSPLADRWDSLLKIARDGTKK